MAGSIRKSGIGLAAAAAIAIAVTLFWRPAGNDPNAAYAQAIQRIAAAHTATYKLFSSGSKMISWSSKTDPDGHTTVQDNSKAGGPMQVMWMEPGHERRELPGGNIMIMDWPAGQILTLRPNARTAGLVRLDSQIRFKVDNVFEQIRKLQDRADESLGEKEIDGRKAIGFRTRINDTTWEVWTDPTTNLPIRIESNGKYGQQIMSDFAFDVPLDESLFSLTAPDGYTVTEGKANINVAPHEKELLDGLKTYTDIMDGAFPETLAAALATAMKKYNTPQASHTKDEIIATQKSLVGIAMFVQMPLSGTDVHYVGKGVQFGEAGKPILWYKPPLSTNYRVVYADLTVKDATPEELPKL